MLLEVLFNVNVFAVNILYMVYVCITVTLYSTKVIMRLSICFYGACT